MALGGQVAAIDQNRVGEPGDLLCMGDTVERFNLGNQPGVCTD